MVALAHAQESHIGKTILILPFENMSAAPGLEWVSESFPEVLGEKLASANRLIIGREDRLYALDRLGVPAGARLSRATIYSLAQQMDVDYVIFGSYDFDGQTFKANAQLLQMDRLRLSALQVQSGPLTNLLEVERALSWDVLRLFDPQLAVSRNDFVSASRNVRLDAFENYVRGISAGNQDEAIPRLRKAVQLDPAYTQAIFQLGKAYYREKKYTDAAAWLRRVPRQDLLAPEANYYLGMAAYYSGDLPAAQSAFEFVATRLPLMEVYNNLGVVKSRRGQKDATDYFRRASLDDPQDADYHFNLAVALCRTGDHAGCQAELRQTLALRPADHEARAFSDTLSAHPNMAALKLPLERIKSNYDENSFRQLALVIDNVREERLANAGAAAHAQFHLQRGRELLTQGFVVESAKEFREAVKLDPANAAAHLLLARALDGSGALAEAHAEGEIAAKLRPSAEAYLLLGSLDLKSDHPQLAAQRAEQALALEPANAAALALRTAASERLSGKVVHP